MYPFPNKNRIEYFEEIKAVLCKADNRKKFVLTRDWCNSFDPEAGVYLVFEKNRLIYVGETGHLRKRMNDMLNTKNHCLRRSCGEYLYREHEKYTPATAKRSFTDEIEKLLNKWMQSNLYISCLPLSLGRKEFEEWIFATTPKGQLLNKRSKRE